MAAEYKNVFVPGKFLDEEELNAIGADNWILSNVLVDTGNITRYTFFRELA